MSRESWERSSSDDILKQIKQKRIAELSKPKSNPYDIITNFLKTTDIPYCVIGGKAAVYYLSKIPDIPSNSSKKLAKSSLDYDIYCEKKYSKLFIDKLTKELNNLGLIIKENNMENESITMIGFMNKGLFDSIIDIHIPNYKVNIKSIKGDDGIQYASLEYICLQLENELKKGSTFEILKYKKRNLRYNLLCNKSKI